MNLIFSAVPRFCFSTFYLLLFSDLTVWYWCATETWISFNNDHQLHHFYSSQLWSLHWPGETLSPWLDLPRLFICLRPGLYQHKLQLVSSTLCTATCRRLQKSQSALWPNWAFSLSGYNGLPWAQPDNCTPPNTQLIQPWCTWSSLLLKQFLEFSWSPALFSLHGQCLIVYWSPTKITEVNKTLWGPEFMLLFHQPGSRDFCRCSAKCTMSVFRAVVSFQATKLVQPELGG